ncbi:neutral/alkaline non-lysosomal ceramidase N-terminal domain-containing protein [Cecembia sp.]|uniref:neutral/alkaline non-lysosomal ceramidase N-terminal domain-containing protein n=1 Tax=Cecembia sp. TaxID=1898110 RepID=UPI0025BB7AF4|nr:neutral/alkaline non-lysosomal ceramidase N-terminal domain-containing protein [Cecembia sp.]
MNYNKPEKSGLQKMFQAMAWFFGILFFVLMALFTRLDRRPYQEMEYYQRSMNRLDSLSFNTKNGDYWNAGWAIVNGTPKNPVNLAGYRPRGKYEFVQDSSFIRTIILGNGVSQIAFLNYELMIVHPHLKEKIENRIRQEGLNIDHIYFTATHTHSGMGGYMPGLIGKFAFGGYDKALVEFWEEKSLEAVQTALSSMDTVELIFQKSKTDGLVANRLIPEDPIDPYTRQLTFLKKNGKKATLLSYSAHPTILERKFMGLSGDYPNYLSRKLAEEDFELAIFAAGTVGSHKPLSDGHSIAAVQQYSEKLYRQLMTNPVQTDSLKNNKLNAQYLPLDLRKAHFRIGKNIRIRPWLFNLLVGDTAPHFDIIQIDNTILISSSGEISGTFMEPWEKYAKEKGLNLLITCFNGGYIGYITPDQYYDEKLYEVRDMNWFGPYNGNYFDEIITKTIDKIKEQ